MSRLYKNISNQSKLGKPNYAVPLSTASQDKLKLGKPNYAIPLSTAGVRSTTVRSTASLFASAEGTCLKNGKECRPGKKTEKGRVQFHARDWKWSTTKSGQNEIVPYKFNGILNTLNYKFDKILASVRGETEKDGGLNKSDIIKILNANGMYGGGTTKEVRARLGTIVNVKSEAVQRNSDDSDEASDDSGEASDDAVKGNGVIYESIRAGMAATDIGGTFETAAGFKYKKKTKTTYIKLDGEASDDGVKGNGVIYKSIRAVMAATDIGGTFETAAGFKYKKKTRTTYIKLDGGAAPPLALF